MSKRSRTDAPTLSPESRRKSMPEPPGPPGFTNSTPSRLPEAGRRANASWMRPRPGCDQSSGTDTVLHWIDPHVCHTIDPVRAGGAELAHAATLATSETTSSDTDARLTALGARC